MGRSVEAPELESRVRHHRMRQGLSQRALADATGLTRQAISAIEVGQYVPNTAVGLRLAHALNCQVEELFVFRSTPPAPDVMAGSSAGPADRLAVAHVGDRWISYPLVGDWGLQSGFQSADLVHSRSETNDQPYFLTPIEQLEHTAVLMGCDPSLGMLAAHLAVRHPEARLRWLPTASQPALDAVAAGDAHLAGTHLPDPIGSDYNVAPARRALASTGGLIVRFARWELGLAVARGNPLGIHGVADLARASVRMVNREPGAGSRALLDALLVRAGVPTDKVAGYEHLARSHWAAATAVASGGADAAVTLRANAQAVELDFVALDEVWFDFVIPRHHLSHPAVATLLELLQSAALRAEIGSLPGYDVTSMGAVRADISPN